MVAKKAQEKVALKEVQRVAKMEQRKVESRDYLSAGMKDDGEVVLKAALLVALSAEAKADKGDDRMAEWKAEWKAWLSGVLKVAASVA